MNSSARPATRQKERIQRPHVVGNYASILGQRSRDLPHQYSVGGVPPPGGRYPHRILTRTGSASGNRSTTKRAVVSPRQTLVHNPVTWFDDSPAIHDEWGLHLVELRVEGGELVPPGNDQCSDGICQRTIR